MTAMIDPPYHFRHPQQSPYDLFRAELIAAGGSTDVQADIIDAATGAILREGGRYPRRVMSQPNPPVASRPGALQIRFFASTRSAGVIVSPPLPFNDADEQHTAYMLLAAGGGATNDFSPEEEARWKEAVAAI
jgi:hypothetical protein